MTYRDELISLLCKAENISTTLEIEECIWEVRPRLQRSFWTAVRDRLQVGLQRERLDRQWLCSTMPGLDPFKDLRKDDVGFRCIVRSPATSRPPRVQAALGVGSSKLYTGVGFIGTRPEVAIQEISGLAYILEQEQFRLPRTPDEERFWIAWIEPGENIQDRGFLIDVASDATLVADKAIEPLIALLKNHGQRIESIDNALQ